MPPGEFLAGLGLLFLTVGSALAFAALVLRRRFGALSGVPRILAFALLAVFGFVAVHLAPGALQVLGKPGVGVSSVALVATALALRSRAAGRAAPEFPPGPASGRMSWGLAGTAIGLVVLYALANAAERAGIATDDVDMTMFHLPNVAMWIQNGGLWQIEEFVPYRSLGTYPDTSNLVMLGAILPFDSDFLIPLVNYPFLVVSGLAVYALGRELSAPAATSALLAACVVALPAVVRSAFVGMADTLMLATFTPGLFFLVRERRTGARADLVLGGLGLGLAFGTKWYAVPAVAIAIAGWATLALIERRAPRRVAAQTAILVGLVAFAGGFWLVRNLVGVGNPVFPLEVSVAGLTLFAAPFDVSRSLLGFSLVDYVGEPSVWRPYLWPSYLSVMGYASLLMWGALIVACVVAWRRRAHTVLLCVAVAAGIVTVFVFTPYTAYGREGRPFLGYVTARYVVPALVIGAASAAWVIGRAGWWRPLLEVVVFAAFVDVLLRNESVSSTAIVKGAGAAACLACAGWLVLRWHRDARLGIRSNRFRLVAVASAAAVVGFMFAQEERFNETRYRATEGTGSWVTENAPAGNRVGVVGEGVIVYPMFGPRLENEVEYVGPIVDGMLLTYSERGPFEAAIRRGRYDLVLVQDGALVKPGLPARHERWVRALGYELVATGRHYQAGGQPSRLYRAGDDSVPTG